MLPDGKTTIKTDRLLLRELTPRDVDALGEVLGDPEAMRFYPAPYKPEQVAAWIGWVRDSYDRNGFGLWAVIRRSDGRFLGDCGPMLQPVEGRSEIEIGYHIIRSEWGRGYATEAARACLDYAFQALGAERVVSIVNPANVQSRRVATKIHRHEREFVWDKHNATMCLYWTDRSDLVEAER